MLRPGVGGASSPSTSRSVTVPSIVTPPALRAASMTWRSASSPLRYQTPLRSVSSGSIAERSTPSGGGGGSGSGWPVHPLSRRPMATAAVSARTRIRRLLTGVGDAGGLGTLARERVGAEAHVVGDARGAHDEAGLLVELP